VVRGPWQFFADFSDVVALAKPVASELRKFNMGIVCILGGAVCEVDGGGEGDLDRKVSLLVRTSMDEIVLLPWLLWVACAE